MERREGRKEGRESVKRDRDRDPGLHTVGQETPCHNLISHFHLWSILLLHFQTSRPFHVLKCLSQSPSLHIYIFHTYILPIFHLQFKDCKNILYNTGYHFWTFNNSHTRDVYNSQGFIINQVGRKSRIVLIQVKQKRSQPNLRGLLVKPNREGGGARDLWNSSQHSQQTFHTESVKHQLTRFGISGYISFHF